MGTKNKVANLFLQQQICALHCEHTVMERHWLDYASAQKGKGSGNLLPKVLRLFI